MVTGNQTIEIHVGDENDNPPILTESAYSFVMPENQPIGSSVFEVLATDDDIGDNAKLQYTVSGTDAEFFYIDSIYATGAGVIKIAKVG